jgi:hypothetical protein
MAKEGLAKPNQEDTCRSQVRNRRRIVRSMTAPTMRTASGNSWTFFPNGLNGHHCRTIPGQETAALSAPHRLDGPVPTFIGYQPHKCDSALNGFIQIFTRGIPFYKAGLSTMFRG